MNRKGWLGSIILLAAIGAIAFGLAVWKRNSLQQANAAAANQPEPAEAVNVAEAVSRDHRRLTTSIGTVLALRSVTLRNELSGIVRQVALTPGQIVDEGTVLVALDVSVEEAELKAQEAQAALAETSLRRTQRLGENRVAADVEVDRARAEYDVALAQMARTKAVMDRKTIRAPFRARIGMADIHPGQYLYEGSLLTTLQGVDEAVHVDFTVAQAVAEALQEGDTVEIGNSGQTTSLSASIVAVDAKIDQNTRNAWVRAKIADASKAPRPGASVLVRVPVGASQKAVGIPVSALRKGPEGDHVFVVAPDQAGKLRASVRRVEAGLVTGDEVLIFNGLKPGERIATSGSFKLREMALVTATEEPKPGTSGGPAQASAVKP